MKSTNDVSLIDTNILIYAHDKDSPFFNAAYSFLKSHVINHSICFAAQNFLEAYRIWTQKLEKPLTEKQAWKILDYYKKDCDVPVLYFSDRAYALLKNLSNLYKIHGVHIFDCQLVATMLSYDVTRLYTANAKDFRMYSEITVMNPFEKEAL